MKSPTHTLEPGACLSALLASQDIDWRVIDLSQPTPPLDPLRLFGTSWTGVLAASTPLPQGDDR